MDENAKRGLAAYQRWGKPEEKAPDDWLARLAEHDFSTPQNRINPVPKPPLTTPAPSSKKPASEEPRLEKTTVPETALTKGNKFNRVAKFLILIGCDQAAKVMANLDEEQIDAISREIVTIDKIDTEEANAIFAEFYTLLAGNSRFKGSTEGGVEEARRLLYAAFGPEKGEVVLRRSVKGAEEGIFDFLEDFSGEQLVALLRGETAAVGAIILSRINPKLSAAALNSAEGAWRKETVLRIGRLGHIAPEVLEKVAESLREKARRIGSQKTDEVDGMGTLAAILKHTDLSFGERLLQDLSKSDADLSNNIKERLFTLDDIIKAEDRPIQEKLHTMSSAEIAVLIKGRPDNFTEKILSNISANRRHEVKMESDMIGPIPKKDSEAAIKDFLEWFRHERESGAILMLGDDIVE